MTELPKNFSLNSVPSVFVSSASSLKSGGGGVQIWTQENLKTLQAAGFATSIISYEWDRRLWVRLKRKLCPEPYTDALPPSLVDDVIAQAEKISAEFIFLNGEEASALVKPLRARLSRQYKVVLFSVGLASVDYLHTIRSRGGGDAFSQANFTDLRVIAQQLVAECKQRQDIDHVFCLAPFEVEIERWLGAKRVTWLPRTISERPLNWQPNPKRLGFVGTLDHPPTVEGLTLFLEALQKIADQDVHLRIVGSPTAAASTITKRFPLVEYLGRLSDEELEKEASTWSCFVHPIFCYARGCSTKLAVALGWQIPVVTTPAGCRGYSWREGILPLAETPESLARLALEMLMPEVAHSAHREISALAQSAPTLAEVAAQVRSSLLVSCQSADPVAVDDTVPINH
jgi:hypothetical protein